MLFNGPNFNDNQMITCRIWDTNKKLLNKNITINYYCATPTVNVNAIHMDFSFYFPISN